MQSTTGGGWCMHRKRRWSGLYKDRLRYASQLLKYHVKAGTVKPKEIAKIEALLESENVAPQRFMWADIHYGTPRGCRSLPSTNEMFRDCRMLFLGILAKYQIILDV